MIRTLHPVHNDPLMEHPYFDLMQAARKIAAEASLRILDIYIREDVQIKTKKDLTPLTQADMASHHHILERLQQLTPDIPVLSEENAEEIGVSERLGWSRYWLVDPLDGTKEFIARNGEFTVNIALIENHQPTIGVVTVPAKKISYFAARGEGAFKAGSDEKPHSIHCTHCADFNSEKPNKTRIVTSRRTGLEKLNHFLATIPQHETLAMGSSIKMCLIAEGAADIYPRLGPTSEWDTAASQCIVEEAGGAIVNFETQQVLQYGAKENLLNPEFLTVGKLSAEQMNQLRP